jgi:hypothetical protein
MPSLIATIDRDNHAIEGNERRSPWRPAMAASGASSLYKALAVM